MSLTTYITPLLYRHQCVVVPGFGAFLTHNISAVFSPKTHTFYPPSKAISFNEQIKIGDGLLVAYVASCQGVSYDDAMKFVAQSVSEWETALAQGSSLDLAELGHISVSKNGKLQFESYKTTNYLSAAFGLSAVQSDPLAAKAADLPVVAQSIETPEKPVVSSPDHGSSLRQKPPSIWDFSEASSSAAGSRFPIRPRLGARVEMACRRDRSFRERGFFPPNLFVPARRR